MVAGKRCSQRDGTRAARLGRPGGCGATAVPHKGRDSSPAEHRPLSQPFRTGRPGGVPKDWTRHLNQ
ncbi:hypothetical protein ILP97_02820 [Amycolatopsis sp. H6(2020)]|nr:hypothetical protein [Amycolatopsis sp. H6(2020)]